MLIYCEHLIIYLKLPRLHHYKTCINPLRIGCGGSDKQNDSTTCSMWFLSELPWHFRWNASGCNVRVGWKLKRSDVWVLILSTTKCLCAKEIDFGLHQPLQWQFWIFQAAINNDPGRQQKINESLTSLNVRHKEFIVIGLSCQCKHTTRFRCYLEQSISDQ